MLVYQRVDWWIDGWISEIVLKFRPTKRICVFFVGDIFFTMEIHSVAFINFIISYPVCWMVKPKKYPMCLTYLSPFPHGFNSFQGKVLEKVLITGRRKIFSLSIHWYIYIYIIIIIIIIGIIISIIGISIIISMIIICMIIIGIIGILGIGLIISSSMMIRLYYIIL